MNSKAKQNAYIEAQVELAEHLGLSPVEVIHASLHTVALLSWNVWQERDDITWRARKKWLLEELKGLLTQMPEFQKHLNEQDPSKS